MSLPGDNVRVPIKILRDSAASQSFILCDVLAFSKDSSVGSDVPVLGFAMEDIGVPLHRVSVESDLVAGEVEVGVRAEFPIKGIHFIMGNDLAGSKVLGTSEITLVPIKTFPDELAVKFPKVFSACAVTRSMHRKQQQDKVNLSDSFLCKPTVDVTNIVPLVANSSKTVEDVADVDSLSLSRQQLIEGQKK